MRGAGRLPDYAYEARVARDLARMAQLNSGLARRGGDLRDLAAMKRRGARRHRRKKLARAQKRHEGR